MTALATTERESEPAGPTVRFADGRREERTSNALGHYVKQAAGLGVRVGVREVDLRLCAPLPSDGVELVDAPGARSVPCGRAVGSTSSG